MAVDESCKKKGKFRSPDIKKIAVDKWKLLFSCKVTLKVSMMLCLILSLTEAVEMFQCQLDVPREQRFFSCMVFSVYEVIRGSSQLLSVV